MVNIVTTVYFVYADQTSHDQQTGKPVKDYSIGRYK